MKFLALIIWLCVSAISAFANPGGVPNGGVGNGNGNGNGMHGAPAPLLGFGIPSAAAVGGVLIAARVLERRRRYSRQIRNDC